MDTTVTANSTRPSMGCFRKAARKERKAARRANNDDDPSRIRKPFHMFPHAYCPIHLAANLVRCVAGSAKNALMTKRQPTDKMAADDLKVPDGVVYRPASSDKTLVLTGSSDAPPPYEVRT